MKDKFKLTKRELQLLEMFSKGKTSNQCAEELHLSYYTIETHRKNIHRKLGTHNIINALKMINSVSAYIIFFMQSFLDC
ncbi:MAG: helix-turn-helix transcriptional regulator [Ilyomonas sp.]